MKSGIKWKANGKPKKVQQNMNTPENLTEKMNRVLAIAEGYIWDWETPEGIEQWNLSKEELHGYNKDWNLIHRVLGKVFPILETKRRNLLDAAKYGELVKVRDLRHNIICAMIPGDDIEEAKRSIYEAILYLSPEVENSLGSI